MLESTFQQFRKKKSAAISFMRPTYKLFVDGGECAALEKTRAELHCQKTTNYKKKETNKQTSFWHDQLNRPKFWSGRL